MNTIDSSSADILQRLLSSNSDHERAEILTDLPTATTVEILDQLSWEQSLGLLRTLPPEDAGRVISDFDIEQILELFNQLTRADFAALFTHMYSDIRADVYQELTKDEQAELLPFLSKKVRENVISLSSYPPETAGGIMNTDFATVKIHMTASQALAKIREDAPTKKMFYYIYVVDDSMTMNGIVTLKDLVMASPEHPVSDLYQEFFVYADVAEDREEVAQKVEKYDLVAIPVLNTYRQIVGIVGHDDAVDVIRAEHTEDLEKFMGIVPSEDDEEYLSTSSFAHFKRRVFWVMGLALIGILSGMIINVYQDMLQQLIVLALYMPMMAATGGNAGSQAATVVIRAMALEQVDPKQWALVLFKELKISLMISICLGLLVYFRVYLTADQSGPVTLQLSAIALAIAIALCLQIVTSTIMGAGLPLLVKRLGGDPALVASPAITTMVDISGLLIYFYVASLAFAPQ